MVFVYILRQSNNRCDKFLQQKTVKFKSNITYFIEPFTNYLNKLC